MALYNYQDYVVDSQGRPVVNLNISVLSQAGLGQPANTVRQPGTPLASIFATESGNVALPNPMNSGNGNGISGLGNFQFYANAGYYTLQFYGGVLSSPLVQSDVFIGSGSGALTYGNVSVNGNINGTNTNFTLQQTPAFPSELILTLGGVILAQGNDYTLSGANISMGYAPTANAVIGAYYVV